AESLSDLRTLHVRSPVAWHYLARQFYWSQLSMRTHAPTCYHSLHFHRDRFDNSRVSRLRVLVERTSIWEADRKTVRAQPSLTNADSKASNTWARLSNRSQPRFSNDS